MHRGRLRKAGIALVTTLLMLPIMVLMGLSLTGIGVSDLGASRSVERTKQALYLAEAGREEGLRRLLADKTWSSTGSTLTLSAGNATYYCWNNASGSSSLTASNQVEVEPGFAYILSEGTVNNITRKASVLVKLTTPSPYQGAATGLTSVDIQNGFTDSYNSTDWPNPLNGYTNLNNGHVNTNSSSSGSITIGSQGNVYGSQNLSAGINAPPATAPSLANGNVQTVNGNTRWYPGHHAGGNIPGLIELDASNALNTYVFDDLSMTGNDELRLVGNGKVLIYIDGGNLKIGGNGIANGSMKPKNLEIKMVGSGTVQVVGGGQAFYKLYAPESDISVTGNAHIYGAVIGNTIGFSGNSGAGITYDEASDEAEVIPPTAVNWQRF